MRKLVVGCGYLGKRIARKWISQGHQVYALTRSSDRAGELSADGILPLIGEITQPETLRMLPEADTLLYAVGYDRRAPLPRRDVTLHGLENVLNELRGKIGQILYVSTTSVYGIDDGSWVTAESDCRAVEENGAVALEAENFIRAGGFSRANIFRLSGIYGPERLLARRQTLLENGFLSGNPEAWLNLIHVDDAVSAVLAGEMHSPGSETWLVSDDRPIPRREYYSLFARLIGAPEPQYGPGEAPVGLNKRCDNSLTKSRLQWSPKYATIETGLPHALGFPGV